MSALYPQPRLGVITRTVFEAAADLGHFFFVLLIFFFCFTMARFHPILPSSLLLGPSPHLNSRSLAQLHHLLSPYLHQIAHLMFGYYVPWFSDLPTAINTSFTTILGDFSWFPTIEAPPGSQGILGTAYFWLYEARCFPVLCSAVSRGASRLGRYPKPSPKPKA